MSGNFTRLAFLSTLLLAGCQKAQQPDIAARPETYAKDCHTPPKNWQEPTGIREDVNRNLIHLDATGKIEWNGVPITGEQLRQYVREASRLPAPELRLVATPYAKCSDVRAIRKLMNDLPMCRRNDGECLEGPKAVNPPPPNDRRLEK